MDVIGSDVDKKVPTEIILDDSNYVLHFDSKCKEYLKEKCVVLGIDFGSSGCGFAYSFMDEKKIYHMDTLGSDADKKVPTEIILDDNNFVLHFGPKCKEYLKENGVNSGHYFKGIKMHLYQKKATIKSSNSSKTLPIKIVIQKILDELRDMCIKQLEKSWKDIQ